MTNVNRGLLVALLFIGVILQNAESKKMQIDEVRAAVKNLKKVCMDKTGASAEIVNQAAVAPEYPNDRKLQCYNRCILTMMKCMKDNKLREKVMLQQTDLMLVDDVAERVKAVITGCTPLATSTDGCELAWQFTKCYYEKARDLAFF